MTIDVPAAGLVEAALVASPGGAVEWAPSVPRDHEAEIAFALGDSEFRTATELVGTGAPQSMSLPGFPPGRLRWRVRVAEFGRLASEGRVISSWSGTVDVVEGGTVRLPEGPFDPPAPRGRVGGRAAPVDVDRSKR